MNTTNIKFNIARLNKTSLGKEPVKNGYVYFVDDTKELFFDFGSKRVEIKDILVLDKDSDRTSILFTPLNKFYFCLDTKLLWFYKDGQWYQVSSEQIKTDNKTISKNSAGALEGIGVKAKTGEFLYDWIGTLSEYNSAQSAGTIQPSWLCYITDDEQNISLDNYYTKTHIDNNYLTVQQTIDLLNDVLNTVKS